ncbi:MAG: hypothetical protein LUC87_07075 [Clostridiales bacterium]|nr:hypothetical protein [Clostridiales bacterium]
MKKVIFIAVPAVIAVTAGATWLIIRKNRKGDRCCSDDSFPQESFAFDLL